MPNRNLLFFAGLFSSLVFAQTVEVETEKELSLPTITTYIDAPVVEQRQILTAEEIVEKHAADLPALLESAGVQMLSYGPYGLEQKPSIRGFTDETVRVVIDGVCVNNAQYGTFDFSTINIENIEKLEIVRGGFTEGVSDEGAVGGVIYITTKKQTLGHHFFANSFITTFFNANCPLDTFSQSVGYSGQLSETNYLKVNLKGTFANNWFLFQNYENKIKERKNSDVLDGNSDISFSHYFGDGNSLTIGDLFYAGKKNCPGPETSTTPGLQNDFDNNLTLNLTFPYLGQKVRFENNFAWLSNNRFYEESGNPRSEHYVNTFKYSGYVDFLALKKIRQTAGLSLDITNLDSTNSGKHINVAGTIKETTKIRLNQIFSISVPFAYKFDNKNTAAIPKLGVKAEFKYLDILLDGYRMIQFPILQELYWEGAGFSGNPDLKPEKGWGADLTFNVYNIWLPFSLCLFTNYYESKIKWEGTKPQNVASAFYFGINFSFEKSFLDNHLVFAGNLEYLYTRLLDESKPMEYGKQIMWTPDFVGAVSVTGKLPYLTIILEGNYTGRRYTDNFNIYFLKPFFLLNASVEITKFEHVKPYLKLDNLLNQDYEAVDSYPMPGISLTLGSRFVF